MALPKEKIELLKKWGIDPDALVAAHTATEEKDYAFEIKPETIKANLPTLTIMDEAELNGLKGRIKNETLTQAEELGIKAIKEKAGVTFEGKDPAKFIEALTARLKLPVDSKLLEKDNDIKTLKETLASEKQARETVERQWKDLQELDEFSSLLPANKTKILRDKEIRDRLLEQGYSIAEVDDAGVKRKALLKDGQPVKDKEVKLVDPKAFVAHWMKEQSLLEVEAAPAAPAKKTFDTSKGGGVNPKFDHASAYEKALAAGNGKWDEKAQASYTEAQLATA